MYLDIIRIKNFRRLKDVFIDLNKDISIFVGANNSGKTSVAQLLQLFLSGSKDRFAFHDFSASEWPNFERFAESHDATDLPIISIDLWFNVSANDLHRVIDLLPNLAWQGNQVGLRITFSPTDTDGMLGRFADAQSKAQAVEEIGEDDGKIENNDGELEPSPRNLTEYLTDALQQEYGFKYYVLDRAKFNNIYQENDGYDPFEIVPDRDPNKKNRTGKDIINSLIRFDFLQAQRHLSDSAGGARNENLSRHLSRFYKRNLERRGNDLKTIRALSQSEQLMNDHLEEVFADTLARLAVLGYPGLTNPSLKIMSDLNPATLMSSQDGAQVHYALGDGQTLPDKYNGLGYKNLIYLVVELLDLHNQWMDIEDKRPPLHLVFIEEPEAHLHAQLQQVFVSKVLDILKLEDDDNGTHISQLALTTHSPHILFERGFKPIRYFKRENAGTAQSTSVLNLSKFYANPDNPDGDFLERYLKLTHCDLFFADAAILVEGNVERLLMPLMIKSEVPRLNSVLLCILEIGGAFGHRFQSLIELLGLTTLIVTDLDSVHGRPEAEENPEKIAPAEEAAEIEDIDELEDVDEEDDEGPKIGSACRVETENSVTSNQTLIRWLPGQNRIADLLIMPASNLTQNCSDGAPATVHVCYQTNVVIERGNETLTRAGRTLEEAFVFENLAWTQDVANKDLGLRVSPRGEPNLEEILKRSHKRIHGKNFKKTDFALALLTKEGNKWIVPSYIRQGLKWLENEMVPELPAGNGVQAAELEGDTPE